MSHPPHSRVQNSRTILAEEAGSSLVEFAVSAMVFTLVLFGVFGASFALYVDHYVTTAAREGARYAMVRGSTWSAASCASSLTLQCMASAANVQTYIQAESPAGFPLTGLAVATAWPGTTPSGASCDTTQGANSPQCTVTVKVSYSFTLPVPYLANRQWTVASISNVAIAQ